MSWCEKERSSLFPFKIWKHLKWTFSSERNTHDFYINDLRKTWFFQTTLDLTRSLESKTSLVMPEFISNTWPGFSVLLAMSLMLARLIHSSNWWYSRRKKCLLICQGNLSSHVTSPDSGSMPMLEVEDHSNVCGFRVPKLIRKGQTYLRSVGSYIYIYKDIGTYATLLSF